MNGARYAHAAFSQRLAAGAIDLILLGCAAVVLTWLGLEIQAATLKSRAELLEAAARLWGDAMLLPFLVLVVAGMALSWARMLATPGQLLMGCRVLRRRSRISLNPLIAVWRAVVTLALAGPVSLPLLTMFFDRRRRAVHDWLSDSVVVVEDESQVSLDEWLSKLG